MLGESHARSHTTTWSAGAGIFAGDIEVDGRIAYNAAGIPLFDFDGPEGREGITAPRGTEGVRSTFALDEATGAVTVGESQRIFRCAGDDTGEPTAENCATVLDTGIRHERTITPDPGALDRRRPRPWVSTDGGTHRLRVEYTAAAVTSPVPLWRFPSDPAFRSYPGGSVVVPRGPGTLLVRDGDKLADASRGPGALSYAPAPTYFAFLGRADDADEVLDLTVPAGGAAPVRRVYAVGRDVAEAEALGRAAEASFSARPPAVANPSTPPAVARCRVPKVKAGSTLQDGASRAREGGLQGAQARAEGTLAQGPQGPRDRADAQGRHRASARRHGRHPRQRREAPLRPNLRGFTN